MNGIAEDKNVLEDWIMNTTVECRIKPGGNHKEFTIKMGQDKLVK